MQNQKLYKFPLIVFFLIISAFNASSLDETNLDRSHTELVLPYIEQHASVREFRGSADLTLRYLAIEPAGAKAALVVMGGHHDSFYGYSELYYDIRELGFAIYALDPRGQGSSDRLLPNPEKSHVVKWEFYVEDLKNFHDTVVAMRTYEKVFVIAHSLGGGIAAAYLAQYPEDFDAAILSAPLVQHKIDDISLAFVGLLELIGLGEQFVPGGKGFVVEEFGSASDTHSSSRHALKFQYYVDHPEIQIGHPTVHWIMETNRMAAWIQNNAKRIRTPLLVFRASDDAYVNGRGLDRFCAAVAGCREVLFEGSWHEMLIEEDAVRDRAIREIKAFLSS